MSRKKSFKKNINPAMQFISRPQEAPAATQTAPTGNTASGQQNGSAHSDRPDQTVHTPMNSPFPETKSKRLQLLLQPSLLEKLKQTAYAKGRSVNSLVHEILKEAMEAE